MQREAAAGRDPTAYFAKKAYMLAANAAAGGASPAFEIRKPADINDFLTRAYFANNDLDEDTKRSGIGKVFRDEDSKLDPIATVRVAAASRAFFVAYMRRLYLGDNPDIAEIERLLESLPPP